jgi:hypothetical protein
MAMRYASIDSALATALPRAPILKARIQLVSSSAKLINYAGRG